METVERRRFVWTVFAAAAALAFPIAAGRVYRVRFRVALNGMGEREFLETQAQYENNSAIERVSQKFYRNGKLLGNSFSRGADSLTWTYDFKNEASFTAWEKSLYANNLVRREDRPYKVERESAYVSGWLALTGAT